MRIVSVKDRFRRYLRAEVTRISQAEAAMRIAHHTMSCTLLSSLVRAPPPPPSRTPDGLWHFQRTVVEGKREDESMRQFNKRVREGTAQLLKDEFKEHSSTNKRRKK